jgi:hypothetical protein
MQRNAKVAVTAVVVLLVGALAALFVKNQKTSADYVAMKASEEAARTRYSQTIDAIAEIQDSLNAISLGDTSVKMSQRSLESEQTGTNHQEALDRIAMLRESIERNKQRINQLEASLHHSGNKVKGLEKMVLLQKGSRGEGGHGRRALEPRRESADAGGGARDDGPGEVGHARRA